MKVGDVVILNSGSHMMTVVAIALLPEGSTSDPQGWPVATVAWHKQDAQGMPTLEVQALPVACLVQVQIHEGVVH